MLSVGHFRVNLVLTLVLHGVVSVLIRATLMWV